MAVVGCGQWGMNHIRNFSALDGVAVRWCCDTRAQRLATVRQYHPHVRCTERVDEVLGDAAVEAIVVATPTADHYAVARAALTRDKDVLCEKPLAVSSAQCEALIALAEQRRRLLMVGHVFVYNPAVRLLRERIAEGTLGQLYYLSARRTNLGPIRADVDAMWDLASHDLSIFDYLLDGAMPVRVSAYGGAFLDTHRSDVAFVALEYPNHVVAHAHVSWLDPQKRREVTIVGSRQMAIFNDAAPEAPLWLYDKGAHPMRPAPYTTYAQFQALSWERDTTAPSVQRSEPLLHEARHFVDCIAHRRQPQTDGHNGWRIVRILEAVSQSMQQHGAPMHPKTA